MATQHLVRAIHGSYQSPLTEEELNSLRAKAEKSKPSKGLKLFPSWGKKDLLPVIKGAERGRSASLGNFTEYKKGQVGIPTCIFMLFINYF